MPRFEKGETLSDGLKNTECFPDIMVSMVAAGEASGKIDVAFDRMSAHFEKSAKLNGMIKKSGSLSDYRCDCSYCGCYCNACKGHPKLLRDVQ